MSSSVCNSPSGTKSPSAWSEHIAGEGHVFLPHQNVKSRAGPRKMFTHTSRRVGLGHCWNSGALERALSQLCFNAATVRADDNNFAVLHSSILRPPMRERLSLTLLLWNHVAGRPAVLGFLSKGEPTVWHAK